MAKNRRSSAEAAIAAIVKRQQKEENVSPEVISGRHQHWIHQNLNKHLEPVLAEVASRIGFDKNKLDKVVARHEEEVRRYLKKQEPETDKQFAALTKNY